MYENKEHSKSLHPYSPHRKTQHPLASERKERPGWEVVLVSAFLSILHINKYIN